MVREASYMRICLRGNEVHEGEACGDSERWVFSAEKHERCGRSFTSHVRDEEVILTFPATLKGRITNVCIDASREGFLKVYGSDELADIVKEAMKSSTTSGITDVGGYLKAFFTALISHYHRELALLDEVIEKNIHDVVKGGVKAYSLYQTYTKSMKLHRGVHGLIYGLRKLSTLFEDLNPLINDAVMLENMYSTSIDRITQTFDLHYTVTSEKTNSVVTKLTS
jgi:magnesium transporter